MENQKPRATKNKEEGKRGTKIEQTEQPATEQNLYVCFVYICLNVFENKIVVIVEMLIR